MKALLAVVAIYLAFVVACFAIWAFALSQRAALEQRRMDVRNEQVHAYRYPDPIVVSLDASELSPPVIETFWVLR